MAEKKKDASSSREKGGRSGRRGDRGGSGSHGSHLRSASTRPGSAAPGTAPLDSRLIQEAAAGGLSSREEEARSERRQPSL